MNQLFNQIDINDTHVFWAAIGVLLAIGLYMIIKSCKTSLKKQPTQIFDPMDEELFEIESFYIFKDHFGYIVTDHNRVTKKFTELEAAVFAKQNPSYEVKLITPEHRKGVEDWQIAENYF